ncbi:hypothetical protein VNI00_004343 [Paramarasmius palmivorus]|uniref:AB hydrolase-1 domain-containing protein n=1 Tax=Paramarasmius palmivorus TaxID=297713 RepID=A0AAW0DRF1_9AGAR
MNPDVLNASFYKDVVTSRGLNYHYYFSPPSDSQPFLVFLHGFPSTSYDWHYQVPYFREKGYGLIVPDLLGYGGTAKPIDTAEYRFSLMSRDIIDILDAENVETAVLIGHDWGSMVTSRIVQYYPERVLAFAVLAVGYQGSFVDFDWEATNAQTKDMFGYELFGYWGFFSEDGADKLVESKFDKFFNVMFPEDPKQLITDFAPVGALKRYLETGAAAPPPSWISRKERRIQTDLLLKGGFAAPLNYYKLMFLGIGPEDDKGLPDVATKKPAFFGVALEDYVARLEIQVPGTQELCSNLTLKEFQSNHWVQLQRPNELNRELGSWLESIL